MRRIALLGSTGSIGRQTLDVARRLPERLQVVALAAGSDASGLADQALSCGAKAVALYDDSRRDLLDPLLPDSIERYLGSSSLEQIATRPDVDVVVVAVAGSVGTRATIAALMAGKDVALATKEVLVAAGQLVRDAAKLGGGTILPIDSEHSAIFQCLQGESARSVKKLWITASGGPFRTLSKEALRTVTAEDALKHPTWTMGQKITIDSATLMNKGLEAIEARWLFDIPIDRIDIVVHPQSIVHSMVEMIDGAILAQLGLPDMRLPIAHALLYPDRVDLGSDVPHLNPLSLGDLTFEEPDHDRFPCLNLAREASRIGGTMPAVLNAANEAAVHLFLQGQTSFLSIPETTSKAMARHADLMVAAPDLDQIIAADQWAREFVMGTLS